MEMTGSGKVGGSSSTVEILVAEGVAGADVLHTHEGGDVTGVAAVDVLMHAGLNLDQAADALGLAGAGIVDRVTLSNAAGIDAEEDETAKLVGPELEAESDEFAIVVWDSFDLVFRLIGDVPF
jgi:hypothetical protein